MKGKNNKDEFLPALFVDYLTYMARIVEDALCYYDDKVDDVQSAAAVYKSAAAVYEAMLRAADGEVARMPSLDLNLGSRLVRTTHADFRKALISQFREIEMVGEMIKEGFGMLQDLRKRLGEDDSGLKAADDALKGIADAWNKVKALNREIYKIYTRFLPSRRQFNRRRDAS